MARTHKRCFCASSCDAPTRLPHPVHAMMTNAPGAHGRFFVSDAHRIAYLDIPRAASTTLRGVVKDLGGDFRRLQEAALFNNSRAIRPEDLTAAQLEYFTFTFVAEPVHHLLDAFAFAHGGGESGAFNASDPAWMAYQHSLADAARGTRSASFLRSRLFYGPRMLPQARWLNQRDAAGRRLRFDFVGKTTEFAADWARLTELLTQRGVPAAAVQLGHYGARRSESERSKSLAAGAAFFSREALRGLCRVRWQEFSCAGFALPKACAGDDLEKSGWIF